MLKKIDAGIRIIRPLNVLVTFLSVLVSGVICSPVAVNIASLLPAALSASLAAAAGNIINDIYDLDIDRINRPQRVLPSGKMSGKEAFILYLLFNSLALILAAFVGLTALLIVVLSISVIFAYSYRLKAVPLAGNLTVGIMTGMAFIFGGVAAGYWQNALIPAVFAFLVNFIREIVKDMEDLKGDTANNVFTFPAKYGFPAAKGIILSFTLILMLFTLIPFIFRYYRIEYFLTVMLTVNTIFIYFLKLLFNGKGEENPARLSRLLKLSMLWGLVAIYLGKQ